MANMRGCSWVPWVRGARTYTHSLVKVLAETKLAANARALGNADGGLKRDQQYNLPELLRPITN